MVLLNLFNGKGYFGKQTGRTLQVCMFALTNKRGENALVVEDMGRLRHFFRTGKGQQAFHNGGVGIDTIIHAQTDI